MTNNEVKQSVGKRVRLLRKRRKISQEKLALASGFDISTIGRLERGDLNASIQTLNSIANSLKTSFISLFSFTGDPDLDIKSSALKTKLESVIRQSDAIHLELLSSVLDAFVKQIEKR